MQSLPHDLFVAYFLNFVPFELALLARASKEWHAALARLLNKCRENDWRIDVIDRSYARNNGPEYAFHCRPPCPYNPLPQRLPLDYSFYLVRRGAPGVLFGCTPSRPGVYYFYTRNKVQTWHCGVMQDDAVLEKALREAIWELLESSQ